MCIRDSAHGEVADDVLAHDDGVVDQQADAQRQRHQRQEIEREPERVEAVSYTHLRAHETVLDLVCRLLLEKKKYNTYTETTKLQSLYN